MLSIRSLNIGFRDSHRAVNVLSNISFDVPKGRFVAILGKSGTGKTSMLRSIAGLLQPTEGHVLLDGIEVKGADPRIGMVFQEPWLYPWMKIAENIVAGPRFAEIPKRDRAVMADRYLRETNLTAVANALPHALSGGMKQRVAIARTLANNPDVILMDEPFGALDNFTRASMQEFLLTLWEHGKKTIIFVTHDIEEALYLADDVIMLGGNPATVTETITVPFARPRRQDMKLSQEFFALRNEIAGRL